MQSLFLIFLQITFVMALLLLLHYLRQWAGKVAFYLCFGGLFVITHIVNAGGVILQFGLAGGFFFKIPLGSVLDAPLMALLLTVYVLEGTQEARRLIAGLLGLSLAYFYVSYMISAMVRNNQVEEVSLNYLHYAEQLFLGGVTSFLLAFLVAMLNLWTLPVLYQLCRNARFGLFVSVFSTLFFGQVLASFAYHILPVRPGLEVDWLNDLRDTFVIRAISMSWMSVLAWGYIRLQQTTPSALGRGSKNNPFDIFTTFFSDYQHAKELGRYLKEWEGRYGLVVENSSDMVFLVSAEGLILNANRIAGKFLGVPADILAGKRWDGFIGGDQGGAWNRQWRQLEERSREGQTEGAIFEECRMQGTDGVPFEVELSIAKTTFRDSEVAVVIARELSERRRMEKRNQDLREQLLHSQRLQALGELAGGIAHDFNNMLHSMQASLESFRVSGPLVGDQNRLVSSMEKMVARSSNLVSQLLGFARKGKFAPAELNVKVFLEKGLGVFTPLIGKNIAVKMLPASEPMYIHADAAQMEQVLLNLLINAKDALQDVSGEKKIVIRAEVASEETPGWLPLHSGADPRRYVCIRVKDNGCGIPEHILPQIFEPFFTTKGVGKGSGMGLAMAYGCIENHGGWIHVESHPGKGTEFFIYLPKLK